MFSSIQCGVGHIRASRFFLALGDMPEITPGVYRRLWANADAGSCIIPAYDRGKGHPVLLPQRAISLIRSAPQGATLRDVIGQMAARVIPVANQGIHWDVDTPQQYLEVARRCRKDLYRSRLALAEGRRKDNIAPGRTAPGRYFLPRGAFAQTGFQLAVFLTDVPFGGSLIGNTLNVNGAVLVLRGFGYRAEILGDQLVAGADPPLIGHVDRPFIRPVADFRPGNHLAFARVNPHQLFVLNAEPFGVGGVDLDVARFVRQFGTAPHSCRSSNGRSSGPLRAPWRAPADRHRSAYRPAPAIRR